ncbi:MAG: biotin--[acetyl-CoA-carboxylase] ligase [Thermoplasmata archaeon]|nr:biotin--[acetyl-CoA-carboxylase] ligase [Thermoplasmata archaeon]
MNFIPEFMFGRKIFRYETIGSTNQALRELAQEGAGHGTIVVSKVQTKGKGRMTRTWESPDGGLWMSILLETEENFDNNKFGLIPLMSGCAVATAIMHEYNIEACVKWPNDVLINGKKACGILGELLNTDGKQLAIIGIGINVNNKVQEGYEFSQVSTSVLEETGKKNKLENLEETILQEIKHRIDMLAAGKYDELLDEWRELSGTLGQRVIIAGPKEMFEGLAKDIDENGSLIIEMNDKSTKTVNVGDCTHLD